MAKEGNKSSGIKGNTKGPCDACGKVEGPFIAVRRVGIKGRSRIVVRCEKCNVKV
jgi:hypothetical protein